MVRTRGHSNAILFSRTEASDVARIVDEHVAYFAALGENGERKVFAPDAPSSLESSLAECNFESGEPEMSIL